MVALRITATGRMSGRGDPLASSKFRNPYVQQQDPMDLSAASFDRKTSIGQIALELPNS
jgi:hypothetical protein